MELMSFAETIRTDEENRRRREEVAREVAASNLLVARVMLSIPALIGAIICAWQITAPDPTWWVLMIGMGLIIPLLATFRITL